LSQRENRPEERKESRLEKLWKEDEAFREELKEVAKEGRKVGPLKKVFEHDRHILRQEWKEAIMPGVTLIRNQKQIFTKRFIGLESRKKYFSIYNRYKLKLFRFLRTYDLDQHQFARRSVKGIPRLHHATRWGLWRCKAWHVFRVRL
jgi:hypothetical protein